MKVLVVNAGSSSLKYQLFDMANGNVLAKGLCERIGIDGRLKACRNGGAEMVSDIKMESHADAIRVLLARLLDKEHGVISDLSEIGAVGHRVVHGGEMFSGSALIDDDVIKAIEQCCDLAPLHNPPNLVGIRACEEVMPGVPQVAVFDTAFHQTMPPEAYLYAIPYEYYQKYHIRRYGFHGTSHKYVSARAAQMLGRPIEELKIVTCHMGNGSSIAAVSGGKSVDTSMGFTPLEGLPMGTRSGSIDCAILPFLMSHENLCDEDVMGILNKKSGVLGLSGVSSDFRDIMAAAKEGNERASAAIAGFEYSVKKYIGAYAAAMGGIDVVVFTAGIGENNWGMRENIVSGLEFMGIKIDKEKNAVRGKEVDVSTEDARVRVLVIPTNEEIVIATDTAEVVNSAK